MQTKRKARILSAFIAVMMVVTTLMIPSVTVSAAQTRYTRVMEYLDRGLVAIPKAYTEDGNSGMYLSWRLVGTEDLASTKFDIYKNGSKIVSNYNGTNYVDTTNANGADSGAVYYVVKSGSSIQSTDLPANTVVVNGQIKTLTMQYGNENSSSSAPNSYGYIDIPVSVPANVTDSKAGTYSYTANDMSVGDVDNDGQYEIIVKWDPSNSKDNSQSGYTGDVLLSCYELDGTMLWKQPINLGCNIRAGAHYTQFIVYDLNADGYAELVMKTAPGSKDGNGNYVTAAGNSSSITSADNSKDYRNSKGSVLGGTPEYLTVFEGKTGKALRTIDYEPGYNVTSSWGDTYGNRGNRFLAAVGYFGNKDASGNLLPSVVMCRGYYTKAYVVAYDWDGSNLTQRFYNKSTASGSSSLYGQGNHNLSVSDVDNDGYDEIVYGSAVLDHNGAVLSRTGMGHGDAIHVNDFNNDGTIEVFQVHEESTGYKKYGGDFWVAWSGSHAYGIAASGDVGRGVMANVDDNYAKSHSGARAMGWTTANYDTYGTDGTVISSSKRPAGVNSLLYWDGDLGREVQDGNKVTKFDVSAGKTTNFYFGSNSYVDLNTNNTTKANLGLTADILGDWREEMISGYGNSIRIYISSIKSDYKLTTLMHDAQYRSNVATENVGYNQPPHTSYYIGSVALASSSANYLAPAYSYTKVKTTSPNLVSNYPQYKFDLTSDKGTDKYITDGTGNAKLKLLSGFNYHSMGGYNAVPGDLMSVTLDGSGKYATTVSFDLLYPARATATAQVFASTDTSYSNALATAKITADGTNPVNLTFNGEAGKTYIVRVTSGTASYFLAKSVTVMTEAKLVEQKEDGLAEYTFELTSDKGYNKYITDKTGKATFKVLSNFKYHSMGGYNAVPGDIMSVTLDGSGKYATTVSFDLLYPARATATAQVFASTDTSYSTPLGTAKFTADGTNPVSVSFTGEGGKTYIVRVTSDSASYFLAKSLTIKTGANLIEQTVTATPTPAPVAVEYTFDLTSDKGKDVEISDTTGKATFKCLSNFRYHSMGGYNGTPGDIMAITLDGNETHKDTSIAFTFLKPNNATATAAVYNSNNLNNALATVTAKADGTNPITLTFDAVGGNTYVVKITSDSASYFLATNVKVKTTGSLTSSPDLAPTPTPAPVAVEYTFDLTSDKGKDVEISDTTGKATFKCMSNFRYHSMGGYNGTPGDIMAITLDGNETHKDTSIAFTFLKPNNATATAAVYNSNNLATALDTVVAKADGTNPITLTFDAVGGNTYVVKITSDSASYFLATNVKVKTTGSLTSSPELSVEEGLVDGGIYVIKNVYSGLALDVTGKKAADGTNVIQYSYGGGTNQQWKLVSQGNGYYKIYSQLGDGNTYLLDLANGNTASGTNIQIWSNTNSDAQTFKIQDNGDGTYAILTKVTGDNAGLDVAGGSTDNGANIQQWGYSGGNWQKWTLERVK